MRHKEFCFFNEQLDKESYSAKVAQVTLDYETRKKTKTLVAQHFLKYPRPATQNMQCEDVSGDRLSESKNAHYCFDSGKLEDCKNIFIAESIKDSQDISSMGWTELSYFSSSTMTAYHTCFSSHSLELQDCYYLYQCFHMKHCFGCVGMHNKEYCVLNKQYSKDQYEELLPKIIQHMRTPRAPSRGPLSPPSADSSHDPEFGQFFPITISPFAYNESIAQEYFPLTKEQALNQGLAWYDQQLVNRYEGPKITLENKIEDVSDDVIKKILTCEQCDKNYKIIQQELAQYRNMRLPVPRVCWECRHRERLNQKPPRKLWERSCSNCQQKVQTSYAPDRPEKIVCEPCYLKINY